MTTSSTKPTVTTLLLSLILLIDLLFPTASFTDTQDDPLFWDLDDPIQWEPISNSALTTHDDDHLQTTNELPTHSKQENIQNFKARYEAYRNLQSHRAKFQIFTGIMYTGLGCAGFVARAAGGISFDGYSLFLLSSLAFAVGGITKIAIGAGHNSRGTWEYYVQSDYSKPLYLKNYAENLRPKAVGRIIAGSIFTLGSIALIPGTMALAGYIPGLVAMNLGMAVYGVTFLSSGAALLVRTTRLIQGIELNYTDNGEWIPIINTDGIGLMYQMRF